MEKTYLDKIRETIQSHPEIHPAVAGDVLKRTRDWMEHEFASGNDSYIQRQYEYLIKWIK